MIDVVLLENYLVVFGLMLVGVDDVVVVLVETVEGLVYFRSHTVVAAHAVRDSFVFLGIFLVKHDEHQIETGKERIRHSDILGRGKLRLILAIDGVGCCYD